MKRWKCQEDGTIGYILAETKKEAEDILGCVCCAAHECGGCKGPRKYSCSMHNGFDGLLTDYKHALSAANNMIMDLKKGNEELNKEIEWFFDHEQYSPGEMVHKKELYHAIQRRKRMEETVERLIAADNAKHNEIRRYRATLERITHLPVNYDADNGLENFVLELNEIIAEALRMG